MKCSIAFTISLALLTAVATAAGSNPVQAAAHGGRQAGSARRVDERQPHDLAAHAAVQNNVLQPRTRSSVAKRRAAAMERSLAPTDPNAPAPPKGGNVGGYNSFYGDAGDRLAKVNGEYRTTWLVDSENGQLPYSEQGRRSSIRSLPSRGTHSMALKRGRWLSVASSASARPPARR